MATPDANAETASVMPSDPSSAVVGADEPAGGQETAASGAAHGTGLYQAVRPFFTAAAVAVMATLLVTAVHLTSLELQWTAFLSGILVAAVLAMASRASRSEWILARRTAQLKVARERYTREARLRKAADAAAAAERDRSRAIDEDLPSMVLYADAGERCRYGNASFCHAFGQTREAVHQGSPLRELLGEEAHAAVRDLVADACAGRTRHDERTLKLPSGRICHVAVQLLPRFGADADALGFYAILTDVTERKDLGLAAPDRPAGAGSRPAGGQQATDENDTYVEYFTEQVTGWTNAGERILSALAHDEFRLYCQSIVPLSPHAGLPVHHETLIRLLEEEENLMPPGTFLPLAEKFGLMPTIDRWVVEQVVRRAASRTGPAHSGAALFVNLSLQTISDPEFPDFVRRELHKARVAGQALCIEVDVPDAAASRDAAARLASRVRAAGCRTSRSGFGGDRTSFEVLKRMRVDYLKIDGSIVLGMSRNPLDRARVAAINKVAHASGLRTIAQHVEDPETIGSLREIGVDFAQGFGISRPHPIDQITAPDRSASG